MVSLPMRILIMCILLGNGNNMRLIIKLDTSGKYKAYFDGTPNFYGAGDTKEDALKELKEKMQAVLNAIGNIQKDM